MSTLLSGSKMTSLRQMKLRITTDDNKFPGMKKFKVHGKELQNLPKSLFNLLDLEVLDLSPERETCLFFQLTMLPKEISQLALLKVSNEYVHKLCFKIIS